MNLASLTRYCFHCWRGTRHRSPKACKRELHASALGGPGDAHRTIGLKRQTICIIKRMMQNSRVRKAIGKYIRNIVFILAPPIHGQDSCAPEPQKASALRGLRQTASCPTKGSLTEHASRSLRNNLELNIDDQNILRSGQERFKPPHNDNLKLKVGPRFTLFIIS